MFPTLQADPLSHLGSLRQFDKCCQSTLPSMKVISTRECPLPYRLTKWYIVRLQFLAIGKKWQEFFVWFLIFDFFFFFWWSGSSFCFAALGLVPEKGLKLGPLPWGREVLATALPGKSVHLLRFMKYVLILDVDLFEHSCAVYERDGQKIQESNIEFWNNHKYAKVMWEKCYLI